jgi:leader peptidase (prepilin peptidase) / N-methyltransferase
MRDDQSSLGKVLQRVRSAGIAISTYSVVAFALVTWSGRPPMDAIPWLAMLSAVLTAITVVDAEQMRIPDALNATLLGIGLLAAGMIGRDAVVWAVGSAAVGFGAFWLVRFGFARVRGVHGLGLGDVKFMAGAGAWAGAETLPFVVLIAAVTALVAISAVSVLTRSTLDRHARLPFGPYLAFGLWCVVVGLACNR